MSYSEGYQSNKDGTFQPPTLPEMEKDELQ
jgi:hypothetical protein